MAHGFGDEVVKVELGVGDGADLIVVVDEIAISSVLVASNLVLMVV